jgi:hypothetical protein
MITERVRSSPCYMSDCADNGREGILLHSMAVMSHNCVFRETRYTFALPPAVAKPNSFVSPM